MAESERIITPERLAQMPVFPLPNAVLIPQGHLPLHVFEPRYRQLVADCLAGDRVMAVGLLVRDETSHRDHPPLHAVAGAGVIDVHQVLPEGRSLIVLKGLQRVTIADELQATRPYRLVRAVVIEDVFPHDHAAVNDAMSIVRQLVRRLGQLLPDGAGQMLVEVCSRESDPGRLADLVGSAVLLDTPLRQRFLEQVDPLRRLDRVSHALAQAIERLADEDSTTTALLN